MMRTMLAAALMVGGCATTNAGAPIAIEADSIRYQAGPCFGSCPVYAVTVTHDGRGTFEGKRFTKVTGTREFTLTRAEYDRFAASLQPFRPQTGAVRYNYDGSNCPLITTDMPSAEVTWTRAIGDSQSLYFYFGCRDGNEALAEAISAAPTMLPIRAFIDRD